VSFVGRVYSVVEGEEGLFSVVPEVSFFLPLDV
jgi:hypothetical protein